MSDPDQPVELEVVSDDFVVTPGLARLLLVLARPYIARERAKRTGTYPKDDAA